MTPRQIELVKDSWNRLRGQEPNVAEVFYTRLFTIAPQVRPMFSDDMAEQKKKFSITVGTVIRSLGRLEEIEGMVRALGKRHVGYGTKQEHYDVVAQALVGALGEMHGKTWSEELQDAWVAAYTVVATAMKDAAAEVEPPNVAETPVSSTPVPPSRPHARASFFSRLLAFFR